MMLYRLSMSLLDQYHSLCYFLYQIGIFSRFLTVFALHFLGTDYLFP